MRWPFFREREGATAGATTVAPAQRALLVAASAFFWSRLMVLLVNWFSGRFLGASIGTGLQSSFHDFGCRWDCGWYLSIVTGGYSTESPDNQPGATNLSFFPAYPLLVRLLSSAFSTDPMLTGMVVSNLAFLAALYYLHRYCRAAGATEEGATLAVVAAAFIPHSFVFSAFYAESLFFLTVTMACYYIRVGAYGRAGLAAAVHTATRPPGFILMVFAGVHALRQLGVAGVLHPWRDPRPFIPLVLAPLGLFATWAMYYGLTGDAFAHLTSSAVGWGRELQNPIASLQQHFSGSAEDRFWVVGCLLAGLSIVILCARRYWEEAAYVSAVFLLLLSESLAASLIRYTIVLPALYLAIGLYFGDKPTARLILVGTLAMLNAVLLVAWNSSKLISI